jgi:hypothetical protein
VLELLCYDYMFQPTFRWFLISWSVFNRILDYSITHAILRLVQVRLSLPSPSTLILKNWIGVKSDEILFQFRMRDVLSEPDVGLPPGHMARVAECAPRALRFGALIARDRRGTTGPDTPRGWQLPPQVLALSLPAPPRGRPIGWTGGSDG